MNSWGIYNITLTSELKHNFTTKVRFLEPLIRHSLPLEQEILIRAGGSHQQSKNTKADHNKGHLGQADRAIVAERKLSWTQVRLWKMF